MSVFQCVGHISVEICGCVSGVCMWGVRGMCLYMCLSVGMDLVYNNCSSSGRSYCNFTIKEAKAGGNVHKHEYVLVCQYMFKFVCESVHICI